jgi:hydroxyacylglutathione hydrolase
VKEIAKEVWRLREPPTAAFNVHVVGTVLIDAGRRWDRRRIFGQLEGVDITEVALTHVHPDHQGVAKALCDARGIPLAVHSGDVDAMEGRAPVAAGTGIMPRLYNALWAGPPHKVDRVLAEGNEVAGFRVVHAPGHTPGEVIYFRDSDRVALCGDVIRNISFLTGRPGIRQPPDDLTRDPVENRRSIRKLAALEPALILPGHGRAVTDMAEFARFVDSLPAE